MAQEAGYVFYVDPGPAPGISTAYFGPEIQIGIPQPALTMNSDGFSNVSSVEFSISGTERKIPVLIIQEPNTKIPLPIPVPDVSLANPPFGLVPPRLAGFHKLEDIGALDPIEVALKGLATAAKSADAVGVSGTVDPVRYGRLLRARGVVGLRGAGLAFDGLYFVKSVTTTVKTGSIAQKFQLVRNGLVSTVPKVAGMSGGPYFGKYRGVVMNNIDPEEKGPHPGDGALDRGPACRPARRCPVCPSAGMQAGFYTVPPLQAGVWIEFEAGDIDKPIWSGCYYTMASAFPRACPRPRSGRSAASFMQTMGQTTLMILGRAGADWGHPAQDQRPAR